MRSLINQYGYRLHKLIQKSPHALIGVFMLCIVALAMYTYPLYRPSELRVVFLDVGQGDAIFIHAPNGKELLIDAGKDQSVIQELGAVKSFFDRTIDFILMTHTDADHIGGFPYVFDRFRIPLIIESEITSPTLIKRVVEQKITHEQSKRLTARLGERITLDEKNKVVVDVLFPDQNPSTWETNEASIIVRVTYGTTSFLLTGDAPSEVEDHMALLYGDQIQSDVLKLGHHGSKTSSSDLFLNTVQPEIVIVSAGFGNQYGHPHPEVIERVESINAQIFETAQSGRIDCRSNGEQVTCRGKN